MPKVPKYKLHILAVCSFGVIFHFSIIGPLVIIIAHETIKSTLLLSLAFSLRQVSRIIFDIPLGILTDVYGTKKTLCLASILSIVATSMLFYHRNTLFFMAFFIFSGAAAACSLGKVEACIYNICAYHKKSKYFSKYIAIYYFTADIMHVLAIPIATKIVNTNSYNMAFLARIIIAILAMVPILFIAKEKISYSVTKRMSMRYIYLKFIVLYKKNPILLHIVIIWGCCNFFGWQISNFLGMLLLDAGSSAEVVVKIRGCNAFMMSVGSLFAIFIAPMLKTLTHTCRIFFLLIVCMFFSTMTNQYVLPIAMILYTTFYSSMEISLENILEKVLSPRVRATVTSIATSCTSVMNIIGMTSYGLMSQIIEQTYCFAIICACFSVYACFLLYRLRLISNV